MKQPNKFFSTLIFSIFVIFHSFSQVDTLKVRGEITSTHDACKKVDVQAKYNGDWNKYLVNTLEKKLKNYTPTKNERIDVRFVVCTDGKICNVVALNGDETLRKITEETIIESKNWIPAKLEGKEVKAFRTQPIRFLAYDTNIKVNKENILYAEKIDNQNYRIISQEEKKLTEYQYNTLSNELIKTKTIENIDEEINRKNNLFIATDSILIGVGKINDLVYEIVLEKLPNSSSQNFIR